MLAAPTHPAQRRHDRAAGRTWGCPLLPNNVIPFDLMKGDDADRQLGRSANAKLLAQLTTSGLGLQRRANGARSAWLDEAVRRDGSGDGAPLYSVYQDPNGLTVNVQGKAGVTVYQDVNRESDSVLRRQEHSIRCRPTTLATIDGTVHVPHRAAFDVRSVAVRSHGDYDLFGHPGDEGEQYATNRRRS